MAVYGLRAVQARKVYGPKRSYGPYSVLVWTDQYANYILPANTCFICYIIPYLWIKKKATV